MLEPLMMGGSASDRSADQVRSDHGCTPDLGQAANVVERGQGGDSMRGGGVPSLQLPEQRPRHRFSQREREHEGRMQHEQQQMEQHRCTQREREEVLQWEQACAREREQRLRQQHEEEQQQGVQHEQQLVEQQCKAEERCHQSVQQQQQQVDQQRPDLARWVFPSSRKELAAADEDGAITAGACGAYVLV